MQKGIENEFARGAFSAEGKEILTALTNNLQLKRIEEAVFTIDPQTLPNVEGSYGVIGFQL